MCSNVMAEWCWQSVDLTILDNVNIIGTVETTQNGRDKPVRGALFLKFVVVLVELNKEP